MRNSKYLMFAVALAAVASLSAQFLPRHMSPRQKLSSVEMAISNFYVDEVDEEKLVEDAIRGMIENLDPHSTYSTKEETKETQETMQGSFSGIGIQFNMQKDTLYVVQTVAGGPSEKVGILPGDRIVTVNDTVIAGRKLKNTAIMKMLRGKKGTKVDVQVKRGGESELIDFRITRDDIPLNSIDAAYMADDRTGYIRLSRFAMTSYKELMDAVKDLRKQGMTQLVLDLTDNGGGYMNIAAEIVNEFLERGNLIVYTEGRKSPRQDLSADGRGKLKEEKVVVMINQFSASASEILAGAIQDWDRGVVVGRRSFGKGLVQREMVLPDTSSIRLTIARYYTPSGRNIQKPYTKGNRDGYDKDIIERYNHGELTNPDSIRMVVDSLRYTTLRNRRAVYGGGGITPDHFVALDTTENTAYYRKLVAKGIVNQFALRYVDRNRVSLKEQYPEVKDFIDSFVVTDAMLEELVGNGKEEKVEFDEKDFALSKELLRDIVKALVAGDIYGPASYYQVINKRNEIFLEAMRVINDEELYSRTIATPSGRK